MAEGCPPKFFAELQHTVLLVDRRQEEAQSCQNGLKNTEIKLALLHFFSLHHGRKISDILNTNNCVLF